MRGVPKLFLVEIATVVIATNIPYDSCGVNCLKYFRLTYFHYFALSFYYTFIEWLKGIRVNSKQELKERIYKYIEEINADLVVYHWTYNKVR